MFQNSQNFSKIGPLKVLEAGDKNSTTSIVLFHGFGASASDLYPLSQVFQNQVNCHWVFPQGIIDVPMGADYVGKAWFPIDDEAHQLALMQGQALDYSNSFPPGMDVAKQKALDLLFELKKNHSNLIIGGFSQGAMLITDITFSNPNLVVGLAILSGTVLDEKNWREGAKNCSKIPFFQSHGKKDMILPFNSAVGLEKLMLAAGMEGEFVGFDGGHEIPHNVLVSLGLFFSRLIN